MRNLETKARCRDLGEARRRALQLGAKEQWTRRQVDTYYAVPAGRLKLRRQEDAPAELIYYRRPDMPDARWSDYQVVTVTRSTELGNLLADALGVTVHVDKTRTLLLYGNTRIHLDRVHGLGDFVELETVVQTQGDDEARAEHALLARALGISQEDLVGESYADMLSRGRSD